MYSYKHKIDRYQDNRTFLSRSYSSKNDFLKQYNKSYNDKEKSKQLYLQILCDLKVAICEGSIDNFKKINKILNYMVNIQNEAFINCFNEEIYPFKNTNVIILACEYNQLEILKTVFSNYSSTYERLHKNENRNISPSDEDENSHNALYYSIRSGNTELLETLISKWPGKYFESRSTLLDEILSKAYEELKLKNVLLLNPMEFFVEEKLINLRFFSTSPKESQNNKISLNSINHRIDLVIEQISSLNSINEVDEEFVLVLKYITINIFTLKRQLKASYDTLPWEEVEFSLICFTSSNTTDEEINIYFRVVLNRAKILNYLNNFAKRLTEVQGLIKKCNISWLSTLPNISRVQAVAQILGKYPEFKELYQDYHKIRDIHTLKVIDNYVTLISSIDPNKNEGKLAIIRSLQAIGECLKNTLESPKLSAHTCDLLFLSLPQSTRKLVVNLRNSLSHSYSLTKRTEILQNEQVDFFNGIKNDIQKIGIIAKDICFEKNLKTIKKILEDIVNCKDVHELRQIISVGITLNIKALAKFLGSKENQISEHEKIKQIIGELKSIISDQTVIQKRILQKMEEIITSQNIQRDNKLENYILLVGHLSSLKFTSNTLSMNENSLRVHKYSSQKALDTLNSSLVQPKALNSLSKLSLQLMDTCDLENNTDKQQKIGVLILELFCIIDIQYDNILWVNKLSDKLMKRSGSNKKNDVNLAFAFASTKEKSKNQLKLKLHELKTVITECGLNKSLTDSIGENINQQVLTALEMIILEILSVMGDALKRLEDNLFFLDDNVPLLIGKNFRNHLAHGNAIMGIVSPNSFAGLIATANKLVEELDKNENKIGKIVIEDFERLRKKIDLEKGIIFINRKMFEALESGDFESLRNCIAQGADVHARKNDLWTSLHSAAKGNNLDVVKFLIEQKVAIKVESTDGKCPLHIAAEFGSAAIVEFFLNKKYYDVNCTDDLLENPLHLAALNNHKVTVELLLKHNANYSAKDMPGYSPLHYAVRENHIEVAQTLLKKEKTVDANEMKGGFTALHLASENGLVELVSFLLNRGANVHAKTDGMTIPLHLASLNGHTEVVNLLVKKKSNVNASVRDGCTPLHYAIENGHKKIVDILLNNGANPNVFDKTYGNTPLHYAAKDGYVDIAQALIYHKANVNAFDANNKTPLFNAITSGHLKIVEMLCQQKNTVKNVDFALHLASLYGSVQIVDYLINLPMDINARDYNGNTPLHHAVLHGHTDVVALLVKNKANINVKNADGFTPLLAAVSLDRDRTNDENIPLHIKDILQKSNSYTDYKYFDKSIRLDTISNEKVKIVNILLQNGADIDVATSNGLTVLHLAAGAGNQSIIELLITRNISVNSINKHGNTPLQIAAVIGSKEAVNILIKNGANVNCRSKDGFTALHSACISGSCDTVKILLENDADINVNSENNLSPLYFAVKGNHSDAVKMFLAHKTQVVNIDEKILTFVLETNNNDILKMLLNYGTVNKYDIKTIINGASLLHTAIIKCSDEIISTLISNGADVNSRSENKLTALHIAVLRRREKLIKILLENGADVNCKIKDRVTLLHTAAMNGDSEITEILLQYDIDVNAKDDKNHTALETAVSEGHLSIVKLLFPLTEMCNNNKGNKHFTVLHTAAQLNDHLEIIKYLVTNGVDINSTNEMGSKPIHIAAREGHEETVKYFLSLGQDIDELGFSNNTPLHYSAIYSKVKVAQYLLNNGANVNARSLLNRTPLHSAVQSGAKLDFIKLLLEHGAMYNPVDNFGLKPISLSEDPVTIKFFSSIDKQWQAVKKNNLEEVKSCIKNAKAARAIVNAKNSDNVTPLHYAAWKGYDDIVEELVRCDDVVNVIGKKGLTPLHYAAKFGHLNICKTLLAAGAIYNVEGENGKTPIDLTENKDITSLLRLIDSCFEMVSNKNLKALNTIKKVKDVTVVKALMNACNREGKSLIAVAILNNYSKIDELKLILQDDLADQIKLADAMKMYERYDEALKIYELVLQRRIELFGKNNPGTLDMQENIAWILYKQQKYQIALDAFQSIYEKQKDLLGENNQETLNTRSTIALILHRQGKNKEALEIFQQVYDKQKSILTLNDRSFINTHIHMALVLNALFKFDEALKLNKIVFEHEKRRLGSNHPETLISQNNIAMVLTNQGKCEEAEKLYRKVYEARKKCLGATHSDTLRAFHNIVTVLARQKKYDQAMQAYEEVLKIQKSNLGSDHIDTLNTQLSMAQMLHSQGKHVSAFKIFNLCLPEFKKKVGPSHFQVHLYETMMDTTKKMLNFSGQSDIIDIINNLNVEARVAVSSGDLKSLQQMLDCDMDVNDADEEGRTLLHFAAGNGNIDIARALLNSGCILNISTKKGNTPLHTAVSKGHAEIVAEFLKHINRAELPKFVNAKTTVSGTTALHVAAKDGYYEIVLMLLKCGVVYSAKNNEGKTPLNLSREKRIVDLLELIDSCFKDVMKGNAEVKRKLCGTEKDKFLAVVNARNDMCMSLAQVAVVNKYRQIGRDILTAMKKAS